MPANDHQDHARRHNPDDAGLDCQIVHVSGSKKDTVGQKIQCHPYRYQGDDHGQHAAVDFSLLEAPRQCGFLYKYFLHRVRHCVFPVWLSSNKKGRSKIYMERPLKIKSYLQAAGALAPATPWHTTSFLTHPALMTVSRLSLVMGTGFNRIAFISIPLGPPDHLMALGTALPLANATAISAAAFPRSRASFQTETVWIPLATRFRAAWSPSCPDTGVMPSMPWAVRAATTPPAVPSFDATTASTLLLLAVRICSIFFCATSGFQPSVYCSPTFLILPASMAALRT